MSSLIAYTTMKLVVIEHSHNQEHAFKMINEVQLYPQETKATIHTTYRYTRSNSSSQPFPRSPKSPNKWLRCDEVLVPQLLCASNRLKFRSKAKILGTMYKHLNRVKPKGGN